jgi:hypothetical protein
MGHARTDRTIQHVREAFIAALMRGLSISGAAIHADIARRTVYDWRDADHEFRAAWDEALEYGADRLEDEAFRRAHDGVEKPLVSGGKIVKDDEGAAIRVREYSDTLMCLLLKSRRPDKFRERTDVKHSGAIDVEVRAVDEIASQLASLSARERAESDPGPPDAGEG